MLVMDKDGGSPGIIGGDKAVEDHCQIQKWNVRDLFQKRFVSLVVDQLVNNSLFYMSEILKKGSVDVLRGPILIISFQDQRENLGEGATLLKLLVIFLDVDGRCNVVTGFQDGQAVHGHTVVAGNRVNGDGGVRGKVSLQLRHQSFFKKIVSHITSHFMWGKIGNRGYLKIKMDRKSTRK